MKMYRRFGTAVLAFMAVLGFVVVGASPASAAISRFKGSGMCLDGFNGRADGEVYVTGCNTGNFQRFDWSGSFTGKTRLRSQAVAGYCVQNAGSRVNLEPCSAAQLQEWEVQGRSGSLVIRQNNLCLARALGENPNRVIMQACNVLGSAWALA